MGYSQAVRHQTLTLAFSLVRIQLSQPKKATGQQGCPVAFFRLRVMMMNHPMLASDRLSRELCNE